MYWPSTALKQRGKGACDQNSQHAVAATMQAHAAAVHATPTRPCPDSTAHEAALRALQLHTQQQYKGSR
ncbi:hypothetical protein OEZ85_009789 [Tetradesmus obliquus]|uniref:Uncharacterized protein n=1 Tax=Tetradesmus obliquus TaxID=3088 RepID=A0ABY8UA34_TETOB|nr:hypothetical protein OEZ85_009789 [Tetradesmus obliquus]